MGSLTNHPDIKSGLMVGKLSRTFANQPIKKNAGGHPSTCLPSGRQAQEWSPARMVIGWQAFTHRSVWPRMAGKEKVQSPLFPHRRCASHRVRKHPVTVNTGTGPDSIWTPTKGRRTSEGWQIPSRFHWIGRSDGMG